MCLTSQEPLSLGDLCYPLLLIKKERQNLILLYLQSGLFLCGVRVQYPNPPQINWLFYFFFSHPAPVVRCVSWHRWLQLRLCRSDLRSGLSLGLHALLHCESHFHVDLSSFILPGCHTLFSKPFEASLSTTPSPHHRPLHPRSHPSWKIFRLTLSPSRFVLFH